MLGSGLKQLHEVIDNSIQGLGPSEMLHAVTDHEAAEPRLTEAVKEGIASVAEGCPRSFSGK